MTKTLKFLLTGLAAAALVACGGGGGSGTTSTPVTPASTLSPSTAPTAVLAASQAEADALAKEVQAGLAGAQNASQAATLPMGIETASLPTGVATDLSASLCSTGTASYSTTATNANLAGTQTTLTFGKCALLQVAGFVYDGSVTVDFTRYTGPTDYAITATYTNFSLSGPGLGSVSYNGKVSCDYNVNAATAKVACYYSDGSRAWTGTTTYSNGTASGTYATNYGNGVVTVTYSNFGPTSGTATITGANGYKAVITRTSANTYTVAITVSGTTTNYSVTL